MRSIYLTLAVLMMTAVCLAQQGRTQATQATGQKTVTGCIAMGAPSGYILRTDDGTMVPLRADRDLSQYVGKRVEIQASWTRSGVTMAEGETAAVGPEGKPSAKGAPPTQFSGSIRMQYKGKVLGDCH